MKRRTFLKLAGGTALAGSLARPALAQQVTVKWWYHFDNPQNTPAELVAKFEKENPGIKVQAEAIPWGGGNDYSTRMFASIVAGNAPDCAQVKLNNQARLMEMDALAPLDDYLKGWAGRSDIADNIWTLNRASNGKQYYLPLHYVVLYLYYRTDMMAKAPATTEEFLAAAKAATKGDVYGFGMRGGGGGQDNWGAFVLGGGANFSKGGMVSEKALAANRWYVGLAREHKVVPPSAPADGFRQIVDGFKAGRSAMIIHHIGSSAEMVAALGDKVSAAPVPATPGAKGWTQFGDESNAVFASSKNKDAAFKWISFLSTGENNAALAKLSGQLPIANSAAASWKGHEKRFVDASVASLPIAGVLPDSPKTADFATTVWPQNMQRALLGQISPDDMMKAIETHFNG
ncbi:sugar ABC transporter substrate-binding protein [uncultured Alsobacter sp.]|uniref:ABC transporter substrate-binding protein n=1 Tax=uncultured Alsobacter sp. TaxID=1748258 RepID=UPI0025F8A718|nr:sugar ABC transporter substrate-binding protein [uncultured Alsobacter sp.]